MGIFNIIAVPLGYVMRFIYKLIPEYFVALFLFTLLFRLLLFPLSLKSQKSQADRARLQPRLDRIQKKYGQDRQKLQQKQMELYEKENVSMTGGCAPTLISMLLLFGVIAVIYKPLTYLHQVDPNVITACKTAVTLSDTLDEEEKNSHKVDSKQEEEKNSHKVDSKQLEGYYDELRMMEILEQNKDDALAELNKIDGFTKAKATEAYEQVIEVKDEFTYGNVSLLSQPWDRDKTFGGISVLWLIPLLSGLTALASTLLSQHYTKGLTASPDGQKQPGQGCTSAMLYFMPIFSTYIAFVVPCGVGIYWIFSNILALAQTFALNRIYNPAKIRAQAEAEYQERRRKKQAEKQRLAESRKREQRENALAAKEEKPDTSAPKQKKMTAAERNRLEEKAAGEAENAPAEKPADPAEDTPDTPAED